MILIGLPQLVWIPKKEHYFPILHGGALRVLWLLRFLGEARGSHVMKKWDGGAMIIPVSRWLNGSLCPLSGEESPSKWPFLMTKNLRRSVFIWFFVLFFSFNESPYFKVQVSLVYSKLSSRWVDLKRWGGPMLMEDTIR